MHPTTLLLPLLSTFMFAAATPVPDDRDDPDFCTRGVKLCDIAESWEDCSELYVATMKAYVSLLLLGSNGLLMLRCSCVLTGCVQFFVDPLAHCEKA
jgi:hypothetical protein